MIDDRVCELAQNEIDKQVLLAAMSDNPKIRSDYIEVAAALSSLLTAYKKGATQ